jgi:glycosyltransferase involved in cell wall biosynthesis
MACGLSIVITDIGTTHDYVIDSCVALVPPSDSRCLAETVIELLDEEKVRQQMAEKARNQALKSSWPKVVSQLRAIYEAVA